MMGRDFSFTAQRGKKARRRLILATLVIVIVFLLDALLGGTLRHALRGAAAGLWQATRSVRASVTESGYFVSHRTLAHDNALLREQLASTREDAAAYRGLKAENEQLRALVHLASTTKGITAPVVSSFQASPYGTFLVGAGLADGIAAGALVMTGSGFVVGVIENVTDTTALVRQVFASGASVDALVGGTPAVVSGRGGGNARALVPRAAQIEEGDPVVVPELGSREVGIVGQVDSDEAKADQTVYIQVPVNLSSLRYVYIVPNL